MDSLLTFSLSCYVGFNKEMEHGFPLLAYCQVVDKLDVQDVSYQEIQSWFPYQHVPCVVEPKTKIPSLDVKCLIHYNTSAWFG